MNLIHVFIFLFLIDLYEYPCNQFLEKKRRTRPNKLTFLFLLKAYSLLSDLQCRKQIQADVVKNGVDSDIYIQNTLIRFYGSCKEISDARQVFDVMCFRTVVSWNSILSGYVENSLTDECISLFAQMRGCGFTPDETTMVVLLSACAERGNLNVGKWVHFQVIVKGLLVNLQLGTALLNMYSKCGVIDLALQIFGRMSERNVWTWSAMILGLAQHGLAKEALNLFQQLKNSSIEPNYVTFLGLLCACSHAGLVDEGYQFFRDMSHVHGIKPRMTHYSSMVDILGRSGRLEEAYKFITRMHVEPDAVVWRTLLSACSFHNMNGSDDIREKVKKKLLELEPRRSGNYVMVANIYAEAGLWEAVANVRRVMKDQGLKKMAGESCIEVSGLIHRFVSGDDSRDNCEGIYWLLHGLNLHMKMVGVMVSI
eukprot:TRINITY_DN26716_c0_g1_i4.p1 TRINITY_DN26716_c0_g1~~TRINITY_DN26716_c0_g1_i4.p1  ORF type:complete len:424 (-),score=64.94 TRINITY_DN26716_c0_g1_i4:137-1408(-)